MSSEPQSDADPLSAIRAQSVECEWPAHQACKLTPESPAFWCSSCQLRSVLALYDAALARIAALEAKLESLDCMEDKAR